MLKTISITAIASLSPLGFEPDAIRRHYQDDRHFLSEKNIGSQVVPVGALSAEAREKIIELRHSDPKYKSLDDTVLYAIAVSRDAVQKAGWNASDIFGINIGSSRGATALFEKHFTEYLETGKSSVLASPATTLGNISSWVAHDLQSTGPEVSHSITCSTALHALLNGYAWLQSGLADKFLVGGSEAPLTPFTIAQMQAMKIYAKGHGDFPCRALDLEKRQNTMVLGEGAAVCCLEAGKKDHALATIAGIGYATELLEHSVSISAEADCFQKSMNMALGEIHPEDIAVIVMHAPGTIKGDLTEYKAIQKVFGDRLPLLTTTKWKTGHTFGASGMFGVELALVMLALDAFIGVPFAKAQVQTRPIKKVMVNAVGFGGNAVSVVLEK
ncbi:beta-ketoacyl synthase [Flavobacterium magnum]|uniref:Beta-ketoacyl synthase n=1 Tax=Flavobacterium magnum TaxID=2162713 RepID=A0A2S0RCM0_9FLAO|nr:beta-ketoacyl synthase N-terminal-like domain-containing protein [Flavobacterium magnum]AWA29030.1 beta-ketoacyl synthase [Flavobacterium magnum]